MLISINNLLGHLVRLFKIFNYHECVICRIQISHKAGFCYQCFNKLKFISYGCKLCGAPISSHIKNYQIDYCQKCFLSKNRINTYLDQVCSMWIYGDFAWVDKIIWDIKNSSNYYYYDLVGKLLVNMFAEYIIKFDYIVGVPSHFIKLIYKGFNVPDLLIQVILNHLKMRFEEKLLPLYDCHMLRKIKFNSKQSAKNHRERWKNNNGVFGINKKSFSYKNIINKKILLIDDVITSGSTANECAKVLKQNGAAYVGLLTLAKVLD